MAERINVVCIIDKLDTKISSHKLRFDSSVNVTLFTFIAPHTEISVPSKVFREIELSHFTIKYHYNTIIIYGTKNKNI